MSHFYMEGPFQKPDDAFGDGDNYSFIYLNGTDQFFYEDWGTHSGMMVNPDFPKLNKLYQERGPIRYGTWDALCGRIGIGIEGYEGPIILVSFWEEGPLGEGRYRRIGTLIPHIEKLIQDKFRMDYPKAKVAMSTPHEGTFPLESYIKRLTSRGKFSKTSPEELSALRTAHEIAGPERRNLLRKGRVGFDPSEDPHPFITRFKQVTGQSFPPYSEGLKSSVVRLLREEGMSFQDEVIRLSERIEDWKISDYYRGPYGLGYDSAREIWDEIRNHPLFVEEVRQRLQELQSQIDSIRRYEPDHPHGIRHSLGQALNSFASAGVVCQTIAEDVGWGDWRDIEIALHRHPLVSKKFEEREALRKKRDELKTMPGE